MLGGGAHPPELLPPAAAEKTPPAVNRQKISARSLKSPVTITGTPSAWCRAVRCAISMPAASARQRPLLPRLGVSAVLWKLANHARRLVVVDSSRTTGISIRLPPAYGMDSVCASTRVNALERQAMLNRTDLSPCESPG